MNMLRNIKFRLSALAVLLLATSCLDKYPESAIPEKDAMKTFADAEQTLTGIYATFKSSSLFSGRLTLLPDIQADLVYAVEGNSNQFGNFWRWDVRPTDLDLEGVYADLYTVISRCNFFLERIDEVMRNEISDDNLEDLEEYTGEVYAIRALCYSELLKNYCKAYDPATAQSELGVVIRTNTPRRSRSAARRCTTPISSCSTIWRRPRSVSTRRRTPTATSTSPRRPLRRCTPAWPSTCRTGIPPSNTRAS